MRQELRRLHVSYDRATGVYYHADKKHLKQAGHTLIGRGVADLIGARLRGAARDSEAYPRHARAAGSPSVSPSGPAQLEERCFLWYRSGLVDRRLDFASAPTDADAEPAPPGTPAGAAAAAGSSQVRAGVRVRVRVITCRPRPRRPRRRSAACPP